MQRACTSKKEMLAITLEEFNQASKALHLLPTINEKGTLILLLTKILVQKYVAFPRKLTLFSNQVFPVPKTTRIRRDPTDDEPAQRRRRRPKSNQKELDLH